MTGNPLPLLAISSDSRDDYRVGPIIEAVLLQLLKPDREVVFFYPYTDSEPRESEVFDTSLNDEVYETTFVHVVFESEYTRRKDCSPWLIREIDILRKRIKNRQKAQQSGAIDPNSPPFFWLIFDFDDDALKDNSLTADLRSRSNITENEIAHAASKILKALYQAGARAVEKAGGEWMQEIWAPGLEGWSRRFQAVDPITTGLSDSVAACTAFTCQNGKWQSVATQLGGAVSLFSDGRNANPDDYRRTLNNLFDVAGAIGVSIDESDVVRLRDEESLFDRGNSVDYHRRQRGRGRLWRTKARLALLKDLVASPWASNDNVLLDRLWRLHDDRKELAAFVDLQRSSHEAQGLGIFLRELEELVNRLSDKMHQAFRRLTKQNDDALTNVQAFNDQAGQRVPRFALWK